MRPCTVSTVTCLVCAAVSLGTDHGTDHDKFVFYMHLLGFHTSFPPIPPEQGAHHVMCRALHAWQANAIHEWMDAGYFGLRDPHAAGWPLAPWHWELEQLPSRHGVSVPLHPTFPALWSLPRHVAFVTDGSWSPSHRCGGAFAVMCLETLTWVVYPVPIPCHLDHSYAVVLGGVLCQKHAADLSPCCLCYCAQSVRGWRFYRLQVIHYGAP